MSEPIDEESELYERARNMLLRRPLDLANALSRWAREPEARRH